LDFVGGGIINVYAQVPVPSGIVTAGKKTCIGFVYNGENDIGIELIRNGNSTVCKEHADRFKEKYVRWQNSGAILNFIVIGDVKIERLYNPPDFPVYHFLKEKNALYKVNKLVKKRVSTSLPTPTDLFLKKK
jgi:hypothetical protein